MPLVHRQYLPYNTLEDLINSQITSVNFPGINTPPVTQNIGLHNVAKRNGKDVEQQRDRSITLTIKTTESLLSYFICMRQYEIFQKLGQHIHMYLPNMSISLLSDGGFTQFTYVFKQLTPTSLSSLDLSYAARLGQFNTFTWSFNYNYYEVWAVNGEGGMTLITTDFVPQKDFVPQYVDSDNEEYQKRPAGHKPVSTKENSKKNAFQLHSMSVNRGGELLSTKL